MRRRLFGWLCMLGLFSASVGTPASSQGARRSEASWTLGPRKHLRHGVDLWPLIVSPHNAATQRVNATFRRMNQDVTDAVSECDADWANYQKASGTKSRAVAERGDWEQRIKVTMNGPRFLSFTAIDLNVCTGSYPNTDRLAFVFDMQSGELVNWADHLAESANASSQSEETPNRPVPSVVFIPALEPINARSAVGECKDAFEGEQTFLIWPDARRGRLMALATGLPHVVQGCAEEIALTMEEARNLGFDDDVVGAIEEAHRRSLAAARPRLSARPSKP